MKIGLDVGSTTIKCVVLDKADKIIYSTYERHYSHIVEKAGELLYRGKTLSMLLPKQKPANVSAASAQLSPETAALYEQLRLLRQQLAQKAGIPAYMIFSNATLEDMAKKQPRTALEFRRVSGVGEMKASWYAKPFLERINAFLNEK